MENVTKIQPGQNGPLVSKLGLGCMRMSSVWSSPTKDETGSIATRIGAPLPGSELLGIIKMRKSLNPF
jgi:hypothetical protein